MLTATLMIADDRRSPDLRYTLVHVHRSRRLPHPSTVYHRYTTVYGSVRLYTVLAWLLLYNAGKNRDTHTERETGNDGMLRWFQAVSLKTRVSALTTETKCFRPRSINRLQSSTTKSLIGFFNLLCPRPHRAEALNADARLTTSVCRVHLA